MRTFLAVIGVLLALSPAVFAQQRTPNNPKIAYIYPAGGERGTSVDVIIAGRQISRGARVWVSDERIRATVLGGYGSTRINDADERNTVRRFLTEARMRLFFGENAASESLNRLQPNTNAMPSEEKAILTLEEAMRKYPYLDKFADPTALNLQRIFYEHFHIRPDRFVGRETMAQAVFVRLTIPPNTRQGDHELRLITPGGITPPVRFVVGSYPEMCEIEPNDTDSPSASEWMLDIPANELRQSIPAARRNELIRQYRDRARENLVLQDVLTLPIVLNGQIRGGDVDRFRFNAEKGQKIVIAMQARHLIPYLADAVPGWFQGMMTLYGTDGSELITASSYQFDPDPLLRFEVPESGIYTLEVRDTLFRGREDFVYRITLGEVPLVTSVFPLGGRVGTYVNAELQGWNLPASDVRFSTGAGGSPIREIRELNGQPLLRPIRYAVGYLPEITAPESADLPTAVTLPVIINGRLMTATGVNQFLFDGRKGETIVCDVAARSLDSPLDATLELLAPDGTVLARNDDRADSKGPNIGLETHHADPYIRETLPADGLYTVRIYNSLQRGGPEYAYRLRISAPYPGFTVYSTPSAFCFTGTTQPISFHAVRHDGFEGSITITMPNDAPIRLSKAEIPPGGDSCTATLTASNRFDVNPRPIALSAIGRIDGRDITTPVVASDDHEQAFIYHHFVPASNLIILDGRAQRQAR